MSLMNIYSTSRHKSHQESHNGCTCSTDRSRHSGVVEMGSMLELLRQGRTDVSLRQLNTDGFSHGGCSIGVLRCINLIRDKISAL